MGRAWTDEQKAKQAAAIRSWMPWIKSTGPTSASGKAIVAGNRALGEQRRREALAKAEVELREAEAKVAALRSKRDWLDWVKLRIG